jgi:hypothetical protein
MRQIEKLVQQIREMVAEPGDLVAMQVLASQYAQHCQEANRRLGQCAEMIARGNKYQTLQLAETQPALLDLVSLLSFDTQAEWRALCKTRSLPVAERIDEKGVRLLNELYATGLPPTEELWKVFRATISENDDARALSIVRTILSRDPGDADARHEVARLEKKIVRARLVELQESVACGDGAAVVRTMGEIEAVSPDALPDDAVWRSGAEMRRLHFKKAAEGECAALLDQARTAQAAGEWATALGVLAEVQVRCTEHGIALPPEQARTFSETQSWATQQQTAHERDLAWQQALAALELQVQVVADKDVGQRARALPELREDRTLLTKRWQELEQFRREVPEETTKRLRRVLASLQAHTIRLERRRKLVLGAVAAALLAATIAGGVFSVRYWRAREFARELAATVEARKALPVEKLLEDLRTQHGALLGHPMLRARMAEAEAWLRDQHAHATQLAESVRSMKAAHVERNFAQTAPDELQRQLAQTRERLAPLAPDLRPVAEGALLEVENKFGEFLASRRGVEHERFRATLAEAETLAGGALEFTRQPREVRAALGQLAPLATELERMAAPSVAALRPIDADLAKFDLLKARLKKFQDETQKLAAVEQSCAAATTLAQYLTALDGYAATAFLQAVELRQAKAVRELVKDADSVAAALLLPGDPAAWAHFKANRGRRAFFPDDVTPAEKTLYLGLRDDDNLRSIYRYEYSDAANNVGAPLIYAQDRLARSEATIGGAERKSVTLAGRVYLPWRSKAAATFVSETFKAEVMGKGRVGRLPEQEQLTAESQWFAGLGLAALVDDVVSRYRRSILGVLDGVPAGPADPLCKAYVHARLMELAEKRPYEWGLHWTTARTHARQLAELAVPALGSGDWMTPARQQTHGRKLAEFYSGLKGVAYAKQAAVFSTLVERASASGVLYAGHLDPAGKPQLVAEGLDAADLWGFTRESPQPALLLRRAASGGEWQPVAEPLPLTPLFFCKLDRPKAVAEACKAADIAPSHPAITSGLPPFFAEK